MLPEKWCVAVKELEPVNKFIHTQCINYTGYNKSWGAQIGSYLYYPQFRANAHSISPIKHYEGDEGYVEITFEQFKQYALNQPLEPLLFN